MKQKRGEKLRNEKGVSPIVSTVLLIMIVIILALIIIFWARGFIKEAIEKTIGGNKKRINEYCSEVQLEGFVNNDPGNSFGFQNIGNVPVYSFSLKLTEKGTGTSRLYTVSGASGNINPGFGVTISSSIVSGLTSERYDAYDKVQVIPILLGTSKGGSEQFQCPEENAIQI